MVTEELRIKQQKVSLLGRGLASGNAFADSPGFPFQMASWVIQDILGWLGLSDSHESHRNVGSLKELIKTLPASNCFSICLAFVGK